ncbi:MAG: prepilin-type N-terminal cleavage/methylation domain-containing protein [Rhodocyclaceae bacterium]
MSRMVSRQVPPVAAHKHRGFTLTELAITLLILGLLIGSLLGPISARMDLQRTLETQKSLAETRDALVGFAAANGRLPCPASTGSNGQESFCVASTGTCSPTTTLPAHGRCSNPYDGLVPSATLALGPINEQALMLDAWGNPVRYAITNVKDASTGAFYFTAADGLKGRWNSPTPPDPDLRICSTGSGMSVATPGSADCASGRVLAASAVAVIYSLGRNAAAGGTSLDEAHNPNPQSTIAPDRAFVSHEPAAAVAPGGEFDDVVTWLSPNVLYGRLIAAGRLP